MNTIPILSEIIADYPEFSGIHPIADCFPMKPDAEFWELVENIRKDGVVDPILREKGTNLLIDGRNRLLALSITNSLFRVADVEPGFIMATVVAKNLHGKQHTASQRAMIAAEIANCQNSDTTLTKAAQTMKVSRESVSIARRVKRTSPRTAAKVKAGKISLNEADEQTRPRIKNPVIPSEPEAPEKSAAQQLKELTPQRFQKVLDELEAMIPADADHKKFGVIANEFVKRQMNFKKSAGV